MESNELNHSNWWKDPVERIRVIDLDPKDIKLRPGYVIILRKMTEEKIGRIHCAPGSQKPGTVAQKVTRNAVLSPLSWAGAFAIVLIGMVFAVVLWPERVAAQAAADPQSQDRSPDELLARARTALDAGRRWQALAMAAQLKEHELGGLARRQLADLSLSCQEAIAQGRYRRATQLLDEGRHGEVEVELALMQEFLPRAERTRALEATLRRRRESQEDKWESALHETYALVSSRRYREALQARAKLVASAGSDADKEAAARRAIGDLFENWGKYLLAAYPDPEPIEEFLEALASHEELLPTDVQVAAAGALHMQLAELCRKREDFVGALAQYKLAAAGTDRDVAATADQARQDLTAWLNERPHDAGALGRDLKKTGFAGDLWAATSTGGEQSLDGGILRLTATDEGAACLERQTARPVRNLGFSAGAGFRASETLVAAGGSARAGIGLRGADAREFTLAFDGRAYTVDIAKGAGQMAAGRVVREAFGDEATEWHVLRLRYDFNTGRLSAVVDDETVLRYSLDLGDFRLRAFLEAEGCAGAEATFRDVYCRP